MKKTRLLSWAMALLTCTMSCSEYDDNELWNKVNSLDDRVSAIENQLKSLNADIASLSSIITSLQDKLYLLAVTPLSDGYLLIFSDNSQVRISNGKDGKDGVDGKDGADGKDGVDGQDGVDGKDGADAPVINVRYYNGRYYWTQTVNGVTTWLYDADGNMIPASGLDAITPLLKVDSDGYWIISYDNGYTYSKVLDEQNRPIKASSNDGDSFFESVEVIGDELIIVLKDGTEIIIPVGEESSSYKAIDLGISVQWATFNLGATRPTEQGDLYLWGDVTNSGIIMEYTGPNIDNICGTEYDIVRSEWGSTWRLPNKTELNELMTLCTWTATTINGITGMKITGPSGNSIFLPPTGYGVPKDGPMPIQVARTDTNNGYYWVGESYRDSSYGRFGYVCQYNSTNSTQSIISYNVSFIKAAIRPVKQ